MASQMLADLEADSLEVSAASTPARSITTPDSDFSSDFDDFDEFDDFSLPAPPQNTPAHEPIDGESSLHMQHLRQAFLSLADLVGDRELTPVELIRDDFTRMLLDAVDASLQQIPDNTDNHLHIDGFPDNPARINSTNMPFNSNTSTNSAPHINDSANMSFELDRSYDHSESLNVAEPPHHRGAATNQDTAQPINQSEPTVASDLPLQNPKIRRKHSIFREEMTEAGPSTAPLSHFTEPEAGASRATSPRGGRRVGTPYPSEGSDTGSTGTVIHLPAGEAVAAVPQTHITDSSGVERQDAQNNMNGQVQFPTTRLVKLLITLFLFFGSAVSLFAAIGMLGVGGDMTRTPGNITWCLISVAILFASSLTLACILLGRNKVRAIACCGLRVCRRPGPAQPSHPKEIEMVDMGRGATASNENC